MKAKKLPTALILIFILSIISFTRGQIVFSLVPEADNKNKPAGNNLLYNLNNTAFTYSASGLTSCTLFKFKLGTPDLPTVVGTVQPHFFTAGDWANPAGTWHFYVAETIITPTIYRVDTATGNITNIGPITGISSGHIMSIMEWDHTTNKFFIISTNTSGSAAQLYSLNWSTRVATPIGATNTTAPGIVAGGFNRAGNFVVIDIFSNNFYKISKTTGIATLIGPVGFSGNFGLGAAFDRSDWKFYCTANIGGNNEVLIQFDSTLSGGTLIGQFTYTAVFAMCVISFPTTSITKIPSSEINQFSLSQNYPNPFNPVTKIKFDIASPSVILSGAKDLFTTLKIFNILGTEITTLVNEKLQPGTYEVTFDGSNLAGGVYFYQLKSGDFTDTKKMLMIK